MQKNEDYSQLVERKKEDKYNIYLFYRYLEDCSNFSNIIKINEIRYRLHEEIKKSGSDFADFIYSNSKIDENEKIKNLNFFFLLDLFN